MREGDSIENAIVIDAQDYISGVLEEHKYIDQLCSSIKNEIESVEQELIIDNGKKYDVFTLIMEGGGEKKVCFDITSFFIG